MIFSIAVGSISNFVLPLGAKGARGFESYRTSQILNKYIYGAFLMIYLSILLLLFFHF